MSKHAESCILGCKSVTRGERYRLIAPSLWPLWWRRFAVRDTAHAMHCSDARRPMSERCRPSPGRSLRRALSAAPQPTRLEDLPEDRLLLPQESRAGRHPGVEEIQALELGSNSRGVREEVFLEGRRRHCFLRHQGGRHVGEGLAYRGRSGGGGVANRKSRFWLVCLRCSCFPCVLIGVHIGRIPDLVFSL